MGEVRKSTWNYNYVLTVYKVTNTLKIHKNMKTVKHQFELVTFLPISYFHQCYTKSTCSTEYLPNTFYCLRISTSIRKPSIFHVSFISLRTFTLVHLRDVIIHPCTAYRTRTTIRISLGIQFFYVHEQSSLNYHHS